MHSRSIIALSIILGSFLAIACQNQTCVGFTDCPISLPRCEAGQCTRCVTDEDCQNKNKITHIFCKKDNRQCYTQINLPADQAGVFAAVLVNAFVCLAVIVFLLVALFKRESYKYSSVTEQQMSTLSNSQTSGTMEEDDN